jgi:hypothetical protein
MFKKLITYLLIITFYAGLLSSPAMAFYKINDNYFTEHNAYTTQNMASDYQFDRYEEAVFILKEYNLQELLCWEDMLVDM